MCIDSASICLFSELFVVSQANWGKSSSRIGCDGPDTCF